MIPNAASDPYLGSRRSHHDAATLIASGYREHRLFLRIEAAQRARNEREAFWRDAEAKKAAQRAEKARMYELEGAMRRVWPIIGEVAVVMR